MHKKKGLTKNRKASFRIDADREFFGKVMKSKEAQEAYQEETMLILIQGLVNEIEKKHLTPYGLAKKTGIQPRVVKRILNGAQNAEVSTLSKMGQGVDLQLSWNKR